MHPPAPRRSILAVTALAGLALAVPGGAAAAPHAHAAKKPKPRVTAKVAKRTLTVNGTRKADAIALTRKGSRLKIDAGTTHVAIRHKAFDRIVVRGGRGDDAITGSSLRETLIGGAGDDSLRGGDRDVLKGGAGNDAARFQGSKASEAIAVKPAGTHVRIQRGALAQDLSAIERIDVRGGAGDDAITAADGLAAAITLQGGQGNDSITGAGAAETLTGGDGNDTIEPRGGDDRADLGTGDDTAVERAGDGR